jgi:hypothetical protein
VASHAGCRVWNQDFTQDPNVEGDCAHLRGECRDECSEVLTAGGVYWLSSHCVHESLPLLHDTERQFVRVSLPSKADWYEGCTPNPLGVKPAAKTAPARRFLLL